jgi:hypothetical protein
VEIDGEISYEYDQDMKIWVQRELSHSDSSRDGNPKAWNMGLNIWRKIKR